MIDQSGSVTVTFHNVDPAVAVKLLAAVESAKSQVSSAPVKVAEPIAAEVSVPPKAEPPIEAEIVEDVPTPSLRVVDSAGDIPAELTPDSVLEITDRQKLFELIAERADPPCDASEVAAAFKGCRLKTIQKELVALVSEPEPEEPKKKTPPAGGSKPAKTTEVEVAIDSEPAAVGAGFYDLDNVPAELKKASRFRDVVSHMLNDGFEDAGSIVAELKRLEPVVPVISQTPAYTRRVSVLLKRLA